VCTGTLLNDGPVSHTPYFWSAAHCINTQSVANTLTTHWFYEATRCDGSAVSANYRQLFGGAQILHVNQSHDTLLLRLNNAAPSGAAYAGWSASFFSTGDVYAIHHPDGDVKKISWGQGTGRACQPFSNSNEFAVNQTTLSEVSWDQGFVEGGSSGSGLFTFANGSYYLRGGLWGSSSSMSCSTVGTTSNSNQSCYSSLNLVWDDVRKWLSPPPPISAYTGQWIKTDPEDENGWGLSIITGFPGNPKLLFAPWFTYDRSGNAMWLLMQSANWTSDTSITSSVSRLTGSPWGASSYNNSRVNATVVGSATLSFSSETRAQLSYNVDGVNRTVSLRKIE
jgi:hypothetical protein